MDDAYYDSAGKRSYDSDGNDRSSRKKRRDTNDYDHLILLSTGTEYRILCPSTRIGSVIGKGGDIIKAIRQETRAKVKVEDPIPGADERVIYIYSSSRENRDNKSKDRDRDDDRKEMLCPAQEALFRIHERITDTAGGSDEDDDLPPRSVTARLLVQNNQIGCVIGKGGRIIEEMRKEIGGQIRVLPRNQVPVWALPNDELVQLSGDPAVVGKALYAVSSRLHENPPRERTQGDFSKGSSAVAGNPLYSGTFYPQAGSMMAPFAARASLPPLGNVTGGWSLSSGLSVLPPLSGAHDSQTESGLSEEFSIRLLFPDEKIGSMIGKGGNIIKKLREETGARIRVGDPISDCDERIIVISSTEYMDNVFSCVIDAALQIQKRLADLLDNEVSTVATRLLVPSSQIGCLIGKGGQIISEMRRISRAKIQIPSKDDLPPCAGENDELVQISGELHAAQAALLEVLQRLRSNVFKGHDIGGGNGSRAVSSIPGPSVLPNYGGRQEVFGMSRSSNFTNYGSPPPSTPASSGRSRRDSRRKQK